MPAGAPTDQRTPPHESGSSTPDRYDFGGACFDLDQPLDREVIRFVLSQALYGEATAVYCGRSLYAARSLEAARFYTRQARQELGHLQLFAQIFRDLELEPQPPHWVLRLLSSHNDYYPLKVLLEHALGEGMVLDVFRDLLLQTLPDGHPRVPSIKKKLEVICREEAEHVAWGEREVKRLLGAQPWLGTPFFGLLELQLAVVPLLTRAVGSEGRDHPVLRQLEPFVDHVRRRVYRQCVELGFAPATPPGRLGRASAIAWGLGLYGRSKLSRSRSRLEHIYLKELGFRG